MQISNSSPGDFFAILISMGLAELSRTLFCSFAYCFAHEKRKNIINVLLLLLAYKKRGAFN